MAQYHSSPHQSRLLELNTRVRELFTLSLRQVTTTRMRAAIRVDPTSSQRAPSCLISSKSRQSWMSTMNNCD